VKDKRINLVLKIVFVLFICSLLFDAARRHLSRMEPGDKFLGIEAIVVLIVAVVCLVKGLFGKTK